jgi:hypothetical protein
MAHECCKKHTYGVMGIFEKESAFSKGHSSDGVVALMRRGDYQGMQSLQLLQEV